VRAVVLFRSTRDICLVSCKRKRNVDIPHFGVGLHICFSLCLWTGQNEESKSRARETSKKPHVRSRAR
jgi:hypothetical protein